jgi:hypothetical protein
MQYGNPVPDLVCGRCKKKLDMAVLKEAVYQDGLWLHTTCHQEGVDQLFRATRLVDVFKAGKRGVEIIQSPLFQGDDPPAWHTDAGEEMPALTPTPAESKQSQARRMCAGSGSRPATVCDHVRGGQERGYRAETRRPDVFTPTSGPEEKPAHAWTV